MTDCKHFPDQSNLFVLKNGRQQEFEPANSWCDTNPLSKQRLKTKLIITGDLNCNLLEQEISTCTAKLLDIFDIYLLKQHIQSPTRVTARSQ